MKTSVAFLTILLLSTISIQEVIAQETILKENSGPASASEVIAILVCILCLLFLLVKLFRNNKLLNRTIDELPESGDRWVANHLNELTAGQLDILLEQSRNKTNSKQALDN